MKKNICGKGLFTIIMTGFLFKMSNLSCRIGLMTKDFKPFNRIRQAQTGTNKNPNT